MSGATPYALLESYRAHRDGTSYRFEGLCGRIAAYSYEDVCSALEQVEEAVGKGNHAVGYIAYEAARGLHSEMTVVPSVAKDLPLVEFFLFRTRHTITPGGHFPAGLDNERIELNDWVCSKTPAQYREKIDHIRRYIAAGDTYQVNFTIQWGFGFSGNPLALYRNICRSQRASYCAYIESGAMRILSASPELFFSLKGRDLCVRPMKGTIPRGRWTAEDDTLRAALAASEKDRAENVMIVDLMRNDLGKISEIGSVKVSSLYDIETFETVHQMTSTVESRLSEGNGFLAVMKALFPCGSVTGAPKHRTMQIIAEAEREPRGIYTGCIGYVSPGPDMVFSVAIRTIVLDMAHRHGEVGVGSGITWDSETSKEYQECMDKRRFLTASFPDYALIETLLYEPDRGYFLLERHLKRLADSARYFNFVCDTGQVRQALEKYAHALQERSRVRLLINRDGSLRLESVPLPEPDKKTEDSVVISDRAVDSANVFLYHKTSNRALYLDEVKRHPGMADVLFCNEKGEITEGANHNIAILQGGQWFTPPLDCGLLPGTFRAELIEKGQLHEKRLFPDDLREAESLCLINSVRRWRPVRLV